MNYIINAFYLAWSDVLARYKKSILGPFWLTLGNLIGILGLGVVWGSLLKEDLSTFLPSIASGLIVWQFISGSLLEGCTAFSSHAQIIRNVKMPAWFFTVRIASRQIINFTHNTIIVIGILIYYQKSISFEAMTLSFFGVIILLLNITWMSYVVGVLATRFKDIEYTLSSFMPMLFFITPVIFRPDHIPEAIRNIAYLNPFAYLIELVRLPILGKTPEINSYFVAATLLLIGILLVSWVNKRYIARLAYWV